MLNHLAIIMDGNARWAQNHGKSLAEGHQAGAEAARTIVESCPKYGIKYLTLYTFSAENWQRPKDEVSHLMELFKLYIASELDMLIEKQVRLRIIGDRDLLPEDVRDIIEAAEEATSDHDTLHLTLALSYGSKQELIHAFKEVASNIKENTLDINDISESTISKHLYTHDIPDPDMLIRTGGDHRLSNYLLWQCAYTELYFTDALWPDFGEQDLATAVESFNSRERRFGQRPELHLASSN